MCRKELAACFLHLSRTVLGMLWTEYLTDVKSTFDPASRHKNVGVGRGFRASVCTKLVSDLTVWRSWGYEWYWLSDTLMVVKSGWTRMVELGISMLAQFSSVHPCWLHHTIQVRSLKKRHFSMLHNFKNFLRFLKVKFNRGNQLNAEKDGDHWMETTKVSRARWFVSKDLMGRGAREEGLGLTPCHFLTSSLINLLQAAFW